MQRLLFTAILVLACSSATIADVRVDEKTQLKFAGAMGQIVNLFGGGATRDGVVRTVAVKGDRKATRSDTTGQIVDLREEKVYDIDFKDKSYKVTTFAEIRRQMEEARKKAAQQAPQAPPDAGAPAADAKEPQVEIDFTMKESGQKRAINGFDAREVVMTIAVREKGKTLEQGGGMVMTSNIWLTSKIAAMDEVAAFDLRYAQQVNVLAMFDAQQTATLMTMYPMMKPAIDRLEKESVNMDGTSVLTVATLDAVASAEQAAAQAKEQQGQQSSGAQAPPTSLGGLGGALGGRLGRRILSGGNKNADTAPAASTPGRATIMTMTDEVVKVTPSVSETDVAIPAGFKQKS